MSLLPFHSHHHSPRDDADDPLISNQGKSARPPVSFDSRRQFWSNMISLSWRCLTTVLSLSLLIIGLRVFSRKGKLSDMEQRWFNAITILLGAFASLGLGSLLGYLGSMLRWSLLARKKYKMQDIELLLAMPSPTGSAKLLIAHVLGGRLSLTTFIVMLYLFVNITGRFSVAIIGLTYSLDREPVENPPTLITNWTSSVLVAKNATDFEAVEKSLVPYLDLVRGGLAKYGGEPEIRLDASGPQTLDALEHHNLYPIATPFLGGGGNVSIRYQIQEYVGMERVPYGSNHSVHSSTSCYMLRLDGNKYWRDYGSKNQTSKDWKDEKNGDVVAEILRVLDKADAWPRQGAKRVTWAAPLARESNGSFSVTYVVYGKTAWECISRLSETLEDSKTLKGSETLDDSETLEEKPHPKPLFDSATLFLLPIVERVEQGGEPGPTGHVNNSCGGPLAGMTSSVAYRQFAYLERESSPSIGVQALNFYQNGTGGSAEQREYYNLYIATLIARLPIAAIAYAETIFPLEQKDPNEHWDSHVDTTLDVKWDRVTIAVSTIVFSQILVIIVVLYYCRNVYVREDSYLTTGELLKTVLNKVDDESTMTAKELGDALDKVLGGPVSYGTVPGVQGDQPRVALGRDAEYKFPGFPFRKRSIFTRRSG